MLFNSFTFFAFFLAVYSLYRLCGFRAQNLLLLTASYFFYGCWDYRFLSLILISTLTDYVIGLKIASSTCAQKRKYWVASSVIINLGILGFFKYFNFFIDSFIPLLETLGIQANLPALSIILPVGISFYTFQTMTYSIDIYRKELTPTRNFIDFALFVAFFPQLVAGPIERAKKLLPQVTSPRLITLKQSHEGLWLIGIGLFKKVVIADNLAFIVDPLFSAQALSGPEVTLAAYAFALQIYCDFSGYSDIARGLAKLLGFELMLNFNLPFFANSPADFWRRWHISLSTWLRDYLYIPLGGNKGSRLLTYRNLMLTMMLGGLWHGAAWTFVLWGFYQGALLVIQRIVAPYTSRWSFWHSNTLQVFATFQWMALGWLIFRAQSIEQLSMMLKALPHGWGMLPQHLSTVGLLALPLLVLQILQARSADRVPLTHYPALIQASLAALLLYGLFVYGAIVAQQFIYFQF